ncbi:MAG TPA: DUF3617 family protein [Rhizomicrobium sp.]
MRIFNIVIPAIALLSAGSANAQAVPLQKPGLWQDDMVMSGRHMSSQSCVSVESAAQTSAFSAQIRKNDKCESHQITHNPDGSWTSISTCEFRPGVKRTSRADASGDFNSKITVSMRSPPTAAPEMTMTATWLGACKPGQKGGDVIMSNGMKINTLDGMTSGAPGATHH